MPRQSRNTPSGTNRQRAENSRRVNQPLHEYELAAIKTRVERGRPLGETASMQRIVDRLNFGHTVRREGWFTHEKVGCCRPHCGALTG